MAEHGFRLTIRAPTDDALDDLYEAGSHDPTISSSGNLTYEEFTRQAPRPAPHHYLGHCRRRDRGGLGGLGRRGERLRGHPVEGEQSAIIGAVNGLVDAQRNLRHVDGGADLGDAVRLSIER
jgi:hypothetical protein